MSIWTAIGLTLVIVAFAFFGLLFFKKLHILDRPGSDLKNTRKPVPTMQGIFVFLAFFAVIGIFFPEYFGERIFWGLIVGVVPIIIIETIEEMSYLGKGAKIPPLVRLIVHILAGCLAVWIGGLGGMEIILWGSVYEIPQRLFMILFVVWTMLCINSINWFDGIYGMASGVSSIGFLTIFLLIKFVVLQSYETFPNLEILLLVQNLAFILFIVSLVYTVVEYKPLGLVRDIGIMFFGFSLAYLAVVGGAKIGTVVVALSLVIFDAIWVAFWRIFIMKKSPLKGDFTHLHHRLIGLGFSRPEARATVWIWSFVMMVLMLLQGTNRMNKIIIFVMMALLFFGINGYLFLYKKKPCGLEIQKER